MIWENVHDVIRKMMQNRTYRMTPLFYMHKRKSICSILHNEHVTAVAWATTVKHMRALRFKGKLVTDREIIVLLCENATSVSPLEDRGSLVTRESFCI